MLSKLLRSIIKPTVQNGTEVELQKDFKWLGTSVHSKLSGQQIHEPTPIQQYTWAYAKEERDMIAISRTGSGKTLGFLGGVKDKQALVLAPTRELVEQIGQEYKKYFGGRVATVYGGASRNNQIRDLRRKPKLIIATPGRLIDLMNDNHLPSSVQSVVLDEADRMLDMGFEPQLREIMSKLERKQTLMFSATWPLSIQKLANEFLNNHVHISIGSTKLTLNKDVVHEAVRCQMNEKRDLFLSQLTQEKTIVFCSTKRMVDRLHDELVDNRHRSAFIHGDCSQAAREFALQKFKDGKVNVLVATDVCGRGIDVSDIKYVINYDMPNDAEDFIHRIGRTGRAGKTGIAKSYVTDGDAEVCSDLLKVFKESDIAPPHEFVEVSKLSRSNAKRQPFKRPPNPNFYKSPSTDRYQSGRVGTGHKPKRVMDIYRTSDSRGGSDRRMYDKKQSNGWSGRGRR